MYSITHVQMSLINIDTVSLFNKGDHKSPSDPLIAPHAPLYLTVLLSKFHSLISPKLFKLDDPVNILNVPSKVSEPFLCKNNRK